RGQHPGAVLVAVPGREHSEPRPALVQGPGTGTGAEALRAVSRTGFGGSLRQGEHPCLTGVLVRFREPPGTVGRLRPTRLGVFSPLFHALALPPNGTI